MSGQEKGPGQIVVIWLNVRRKLSVDCLCVEHSAKYFEGRKFDTTSTRLLHFVTTDHFSMEKMLYRFAFVLWHLWLPEWDEPRRFWLDRTLSPKIRSLGLILSNIQPNYQIALTRAIDCLSSFNPGD
jgi:hypothetical protein